MVSPASGLPDSWVLKQSSPPLERIHSFCTPVAQPALLLGSGAAPELLCAPESWVLGDPRSPMVSGALSQSLLILRGAVHPSGFWGGQVRSCRLPAAPGARASPPRRQRNMALIVPMSPQFWGCFLAAAFLDGGLRISSETRVCLGSEEQESAWRVLL